MNNYVQKVVSTFKERGDPNNKKYMKAYMKNKFEYLGIKSPERRELSRPFLKRDSIPPIKLLWPIIQELWSQAEREFQY